VVGSALVGLTVRPRARLPRVGAVELSTPVRVAAGAAGGVALFQATVLWLDGSALVGVLLGQSAVLSVLAVATRRRGAMLGAAAYGLAGLCGALSGQAPISGLTSFPAYPYLVDGVPDHHALVTGLGISLMALLAAAAFAAAAARLGGPRSVAPVWVTVWVPIGLVALYGAAGAVITAGLLLDPVQAGFVTAHAVVTISWTVIALLLLARGLTNAVMRVSGLVLVAAAVAKLLLFDLIALDGLARVAAFTGAGLVLLTAGARYARLIARRQDRSRS